MVPSDLEDQQRPVRVSDVDGLAVADVDQRDPVTVDVGAVQRIVVDRQPAALIEAQQQVGARDQRVGDAHVGAQVTADHHIVARRERAFRTVMANGQRWRDGWGHRSNFSPSGRGSYLSGAPVTTQWVRL
jgi:hypothetical protein